MKKFRNKHIRGFKLRATLFTIGSTIVSVGLIALIITFDNQRNIDKYDVYTVSKNLHVMFYYFIAVSFVLLLFIIINIKYSFASKSKGLVVLIMLSLAILLKIIFSEIIPNILRQYISDNGAVIFGLIIIDSALAIVQILIFLLSKKRFKVILRFFAKKKESLKIRFTDSKLDKQLIDPGRELYESRSSISDDGLLSDLFDKVSKKVRPK